MAIPFVRELSAQCDVHWLIRKRHLYLPRLFPEVQFTPIEVNPRRKRPLGANVITRLRRERFDALLDLSHWPEISAMVEALDSIPVRAIAYDPAQDELLGISCTPERLYGPFNHLERVRANAHQLERWCQLANAALGVSLSPTWDLPPPVKIASPLRLFVHPHSQNPSKKWETRKFHELIGEVARRTPVHCEINAGLPRDWWASFDLLRRLRREPDVSARVVPYGASFHSLTASLKAAHLALGTDSGPLHLASLLGTPTVVLFGKFPARQFGPLWRSRWITPRREGGDACEVEPAHVVPVIADLLSKEYGVAAVG